MYFCPLCNTRYTAEQPCFCHPRHQERHSEPKETIESLKIESLIEGTQATINLQ